MHSLIRAIPFVLIVSLAPTIAYAALVNINTADKATLMNLTGLGGAGVKAQAVIDYRTQHGLFATIADIQLVEGIGPSTFANIAPFITVGDASASTTSATGESATTATTTAPSSDSGGSISTYVPPPSMQSYSLDIGKDRQALLNVPAYFKATVKGRGGASAAPAVTWSFGDGGSASGLAISKLYRYPGTYLVVARAGDGADVVEASAVVTVAAAAVRITGISGEGITLTNEGGSRLDLSGWYLMVRMGSFRFPPGTMLLPASSVLFPWVVVGLPVAYEATLAYPDGIVAMRYVPPEPVAPAAATSTVAGHAPDSPQPETEVGGLHVLQTVEVALSSTNTEVLTSETPAPEAANLLATAGAATPQAQRLSEPEVAEVRRGWLRSSWLFGLVSMLLPWVARS
ncbi:MAG: helix-hairpin-helix domain-containing protein [bacterium]|nr:helix-hairpin-helix domain-containing protein [bacterium]